MEEIRQKILTLAGQQGVVRPRDLKALGANPTYLRRLVLDGVMQKAGRGLYSLSAYEVTESHSLVEAVRVQSRGVVCLLSALNFHKIGTQAPHQVWLAAPYGARLSKSNFPPMRIVVLRPPAYDAGIELHQLEGVSVPIYSIAKTVSDCFKFRNKIGIDVAIEALKEVLQERRCSREEIRKFARINRVERVMAPYLEALAT